MPACKYSIVRYVPDPGRGEQLNVGVVVGCEGAPYFGARFLPQQQAGRLRALGFDDDFGFLRDLASEFRASAVKPERLPLEGLGGPWDLEVLDKAATEWANTIQFSPLRVAVHGEPEVLLNDLYERHVSVSRHPRRRPERDKRWIKSKVSRTLRQAIFENFPDREPGDVVQPNRRVEGEFEEHRFDYGLANSKLLRLIQTFSFEVQDREALKVEIDATAWAIDDLRRVRNRTPISIVTVGNGKLLEGTERMYAALDAEVVRESQLEPWLDSVSNSLIKALA